MVQLLSDRRLDRQAMLAQAPWCDRPDAREVLRRRVSDGAIPAHLEPLLERYLDDGFVVLRGAVPVACCESIWSELMRACAQGEPLRVNRYGQPSEEWYAPSMDLRRLRFLHVDSVSPAALDALATPVVAELFQALHGGRPIALKVAGFPYGSLQRAHADLPYMPLTRPLCTLASWLACERIGVESGPLFVVPGSHRWLPYDFGGGNVMIEGDNAGTPQLKAYEDALEERIRSSGAAVEVFTAEPGDLLLWHPLLVHGGMPVRDAGASRRSLVGHYGLLEGDVTQLPAGPIRSHGPISHCAWDRRGAPTALRNSELG